MLQIKIPSQSRRWVTLLIISFLLIPSLSHAQTVDAGSSRLPLRGPLPVRNYEAVNSLFLLPIPVQASVLARKKQVLDFHFDAPNNFLILPSGGYYTDFEDQRFSFAYTRGIGEGGELSVRVPYVARNGGIFDALIDGWHSIFNIYGGGRGNFENNQFRFDLRDGQTGTVLSQSRAGTSGLGDIVLEYRRALTPGQPGFDDKTGAPDPRRVSISTRASLKLPTGSARNLLGSGGTDFGLGIAVSARPFRRVAFHGNLTSVWHGKTEIDGLRNRPSSIHSLVAVEWLLDGRTSFLAQVDDNPAPHQTGIEYADRERRMFTFGFWRQINPRQNLYLSLGENDFGWAARLAPDLQLSAGTRLSL
ncbi:MAG: DUF3187 family protein [Akkermansiaceae bacterium]|nr:DUF3187 family protein [Armatimonadota bacterium]